MSFDEDFLNFVKDFKCVISDIQLDYKKNNQKRNHC